MLNHRDKKVPALEYAVSNWASKVDFSIYLAVQERGVFYHSGDFGDIIYALPAIRQAGGGELKLQASHKSTNRLTPERSSNISRLLESQEYIESVCFTEHAHDSPLDRFRDYLQPPRMGKRINLVEAHFRALGLDYIEPPLAWLNVKPSSASPDVIFARSDRYQDDDFDWPRIHKHYQGNCAFVGSTLEHQRFCNSVGPIEHVITGDLYDLACVIAGCKLFVGNQSCPMAIAHGLKVRSIMEVAPVPWDNCFIDDGHVTYGLHESFELPVI